MRERMPAVEDLKKIPPRNIARYLRERGWKESPEGERALIWKKWNAITGSTIDLLLPIDATLGDFDLRAIEFLTKLSNFEGRTVSEVLKDLSGITGDRSDSAHPRAGKEKNTASLEDLDLPRSLRLSLDRTQVPTSIFRSIAKLALASGLLFVSSLVAPLSVYIGTREDAADLLGSALGVNRQVATISIYFAAALLQSLTIILFVLFTREDGNKASAQRIERLENELRGRVLAIMGYVLGELSIDSMELQVQDKDRLDEAIYHCGNAYEFLRKVGGSAEFLALNNLVFYLSVGNYASRRSFILEGARRLMAAGQEHDSANLMLTATRAILQFGADPAERQAAREILELLLERGNLTAKQRRDAILSRSLFTQ